MIKPSTCFFAAGFVTLLLIMLRMDTDFLGLGILFFGCGIVFQIFEVID